MGGFAPVYNPAIPTQLIAEGTHYETRGRSDGLRRPCSTDEHIHQRQEQARES
jgi:hypothetical protein